MKKCIFFLIFFIFCLPCFTYSQQWHQYSDSIISNIQKNDLDKASRFLELANAEMKGLKVIKDTIYADYLYRKGILNYFQSKNSFELLSESLLIWDVTKNKNYFKIMKTHYFFGKNYFREHKDELAIKSFEKCYEINKKYLIKVNPNFIDALYSLAFLYNDKENIIKATKYANEYITLMESKSFDSFNFEFVYAYKYKKDFIEQEKVLLKYLINYNKKQLNNPTLLFKINFELFLFYDENKNVLEAIKYGEKAFEIQQKENLKENDKLKLIFSILISKYDQIGDNIKKQKFRELNQFYFPDTYQEDYFEELNQYIEKEDFESFKIKFDEYEKILLLKNNINGLLKIYSLSLNLFETNIMFQKEDIVKQISFIKKNEDSLSIEYKPIFDLFQAEYFIFGENNPKKAYILVKKNENIEDISLRLWCLKLRPVCELLLGMSSAYDSAKSALELAEKVYGNNSPQLLPFYQLLIENSWIKSGNNISIFATEALKIIYDSKLEKTEIASILWSTLANVSLKNNDFKSAINYFDRALIILESKKVVTNPLNYQGVLLGLSKSYLFDKNIDKSSEYLYKAKIQIENNKVMSLILMADFYYFEGDFYFNINQFIKAKESYLKAFNLYGKNLSKSRNLNYILCDYFIEDDIDKTMQSLEDYQKENKKSESVTEIIYLLKFNSGGLLVARNLLVSHLKTLISNNNQYFHLLSDYEKEILYDGFSDQFEFLNTHLLSNDADFLKEYINFRFYSKSLLFSNSFKIDDLNDKNKELFSEFKNNTILINKANESKDVDLKETESLNMRNREIEKFLSAKKISLSVPTLKDLTISLNVNEAYVEIIRINKQSRSATKKGIYKLNQFTDSIYYGAIIIKKNGIPKFILIDESNQLEKQLASSFKIHIQNKQIDLENYHLLFEKIDDELKDVKKIYLITDGVYNSINIESIYNPNRKQYLIDYLKIQQIQNVRAITDDKKEFKVGMNTKTILFGNPDFDLLIADTKTDDISSDRGLDNNVLDKIKSSIKIGRLDGTQKEIETINSILKDSNSKVELFSKANATEDNLKKIQSPNILHIATHGYFLTNDDTSKTKQSIANLVNENYKNDSYLKSGLLLAGVQNTINGKQPEYSNNGILTAEEAKSLNLKDTELVVLSACETGLGDNLVGEGVIGLQRAFMIAGAKSIIMSLWSVSDEKTQKLMTLFYTNWIQNNMSKEEALYQAKIEMKKLYPEPYYWAGFVLLE
jgi:CHAT domain-containing protein